MLIPEVAELLRTGNLHEFDAEWISRMPPDKQLASALKCGRPSPTFDAAEKAKSRVTSGTGRAGQDAR